MKITRLLLIGAFALATTTVHAQEFECPKNYTLVAAEDYTKYEKDIIAAANWLKATPLDEQAQKRAEVSKFVMQWINGSPTVNVEITPAIMDFEKKNPGMLTIYMASSARFVLENKYSKDKRAKYKTALIDLMTVYKSGKGIKKDKNMEELIKSIESGKMDEWLKENLATE
ncbi:hypothetical protein F0919_10750 [Taibaiella lutea]|uniref:Uncharacterized protein n=1 Tax=Taibaiella lutea TaxID=2608001 RepID=A0A5M6CJ60_9BACT|nr:hypothetical protein [Taibaiella lutea]KAA5535067.1 hypothetical protein F0919_10750 [Taibaiella lutea]